MSRMPKCEICNKEFYRKPSKIKISKHFFCSRYCYIQWRQKPESNWNYKKILVHCHICGKNIYRCPKIIRKYIFCSNKCRGQWNKEAYKGKKSVRWKERITLICIHCKKKFKVIPYKKNLKFCSKSCQFEFQGHKIKNTAYKMSPSLAYVIGVILSDGNVDLKRKMIRLECKDKDFVEFYIKQFEEWSGITIKAKKQKPRVKNYNGKKTVCASLYQCRIKSVKLVSILKRYIYDFKWVNNLNRNQKIMLLKGLWDGEGSIYKTNNSWKVSFCNTDYNLITTYKNILEDVVKIKPNISFYKIKNNRKFYKVCIWNKRDINNFLNVFGVTIKRKFDGIRNENFLEQNILLFSEIWNAIK